MVKNYKKLLLILYLIAISFLPSAVLAQTTSSTCKITTWTFQVPFGGLGSSIQIDPLAFGTYIRAVFVLGCAVLIVMTIIMIMFAGMQWIFSAGDSGKIKTAKDRIIKSLIGLIIGLFAVFILRLVNPLTTVFEPLNANCVIPTAPTTIATAQCASYTIQANCVSPCIWTGTLCSTTSVHPQFCSLNPNQGTCAQSANLGCVWVTNAFCGLKSSATITGSNPCTGNDQSTCGGDNCQWNSGGGCTDQLSQSKLTCTNYNSSSTCPSSTCYWHNTCNILLSIGSSCAYSYECGHGQGFCDTTGHCHAILKAGDCCYHVVSNVNNGDSDDNACFSGKCSPVGSVLGPGCTYQCQ